MGYGCFARPATNQGPVFVLMLEPEIRIATRTPSSRYALQLCVVVFATFVILGYSLQKRVTASNGLSLVSIKCYNIVPYVGEVLARPHGAMAKVQGDAFCHGSFSAGMQTRRLHR